VPTEDQRKNVEILIGLGIPREENCRDCAGQEREADLDPDAGKHFKKEIQQGAVKLNSMVGNFMVNTIWGRDPLRDRRSCRLPMRKPGLACWCGTPGLG